jgi:hypothetical protein
MEFEASAREHTAQVQSDVRIDREKRFSEAILPVHCSPTMELAVDIRELNRSTCATSRRRRPTMRNEAANRRWCSPTAPSAALMIRIVEQDHRFIKKRIAAGLAITALITTDRTQWPVTAIWETAIADRIE